VILFHYNPCSNPKLSFELWILQVFFHTPETILAVWSVFYCCWFLVFLLHLESNSFEKFPFIQTHNVRTVGPANRSLGREMPIQTHPKWLAVDLSGPIHIISKKNKKMHMFNKVLAGCTQVWNIIMMCVHLQCSEHFLEPWVEVCTWWPWLF
jgi:hypothetical protein